MPLSTRPLAADDLAWLTDLFTSRYRPGTDWELVTLDAVREGAGVGTALVDAVAVAQAVDSGGG
ncbi:hypothetical protein ACIBG8_21905 [Nonomuraea sp. NPDC050556]|uniref:hypothetical protein n=1 Tax=Nonomuraea sp. NPDC050556 TaxID=3364369 RepID=UPI0037950646